MATPDPRDDGPVWSRLTRRLSGGIPTTAVGMERAFTLVIAGIRIGTLIQMAPSLSSGLEVSPRPALYLASWVVAAVVAVGGSILVLARDEPPSGRLFAIDVAIAVGLLVVGDLCVPVDQRIGTWVGFQPGYALAVLLSGATVRGLGVWLTGMGAVVAADIYFRWPSATEENVSTVIGNALTYLVLVSVGRIAGGYMRRVAADGDRARAQAAELGRREEERRAQLAIHNGAVLMRLLADPDLDEQVHDSLRREADLEARRMRSYLQGGAPQGGAAPGCPRLLADQLRETTARFGDLRVHTAVDLADGVVLDAEVAAALDHALAALLLNVRDHARAENVVVHADAEPDPAQAAAVRWSVTVHDDGRGFDPDPRGWGVGLREVVHGQLAGHGIDVVLTSRSGRGSTVVLDGVTTTSLQAHRAG